MSQQEQQRERMEARVPAELKRLMEQSAKANRRSVARELQVAIENHVAAPRSQTSAGA